MTKTRTVRSHAERAADLQARADRAAALAALARARLEAPELVELQRLARRLLREAADTTQPDTKAALETAAHLLARDLTEEGLPTEL